jgi:phosphonate transport system substrate-binding protein
MSAERRSMWRIVVLVTALAVGGTALLLRSWANAPHPLEGAAAGAPGATGHVDAKPLRIVMSAAFVSESGIGVYEEIAKYLKLKTGTKIEFITGLSYSTINGMMEEGAVDCAFICGLPYVMLHDRPAPAATLIVAPIMNAPRYKGQPKYYSDLIVRNDSPYQSIHDLAGRTYVYNDELSNSGYNLPRYRLLKLGLTSGFFGKVLRSGSHEESIRMVAAGEADASFVDSLVLDYDREKGLGHAREVRVLESVGPAGICPMAASAKLPASVRETLQRYLTRMHEDPEGKKILDKALLARFVVVDESNYDDIRSMREAAEQAGFTVIK